MPIPNKPRQILPSLSLLLGDSCLPSVDSIKILRMIFISKFSWNNHCCHERKKVTSCLFALKRFGRLMDFNTRLQSVNALPQVIYCLPVWGNAPAAITSDMNTTIKRCMKFLTNNAVSDFYNSSCEKLGLVTLTDMVLQANTIALFNHINFNTDISMTIS